MKVRAQLQGLFVLRDGFVQTARFEIGLAEHGMLVRQLRRHVTVEAAAPRRGDLPGASQHGIRFRFAPQLVQHQGPMNQGLDIVRIERQGAIELLQRLVGLAGE